MQTLSAPDERPRRYGFALTPLADAMFQLLVFFMLSSSLSPYSLMPLSAGAAPAGDQVAPTTPQPQQDQEAAAPEIWHLSRGAVRMGRETVALTELRDRLSGQQRGKIDQVLLFPGRSATVQDIATVLEVAGRHGVRRIQLMAASGLTGN